MLTLTKGQCVATTAHGRNSHAGTWEQVEDRAVFALVQTQPQGNLTLITDVLNLVC